MSNHVYFLYQYKCKTTIEYLEISALPSYLFYARPSIKIRAVSISVSKVGIGFRFLVDFQKSVSVSVSVFQISRYRLRFFAHELNLTTSLLRRGRSKAVVPC